MMMLSKYASPFMAPQPVGTGGPKAQPNQPAQPTPPAAPPAPPTPATPPAVPTLSQAAQPSQPTPPAAPKPPPAAPKPTGFMSSFAPKINAGLDILANPIQALQGGLQKIQDSDAYKAPLTQYTDFAGSFKPMLDSGLKMVGGMTRDRPEMTAGLIGGLMPSIAEPLLGTPFGLPGAALLHGALSGGESGVAAGNLLRPLLDRF